MNVILPPAPSINLSYFLKWKRIPKLHVCIVACLFVSFVSTAQTRYYVNQAVATSGDVKSWSAAFKTLSERL
ncbi:MAG: hypothetical protein ABIN04_04765 [Ginsengibacter sp.]